MRAMDLYGESVSGEWQDDEKTGAKWALRRYGSSCILAFSCDDSKTQWIGKKVTLFPHAHRPWKAHAGFAEKYFSIREAIMRALKEARPQQLYVTGYSQGGALATIAFEDIMAHTSWINPRMYLHGAVFGSPRVVSWGAPSDGWEGFVRYECTGDILTRMPPFLLGYKHVGERYPLGKPSLPNPMRHAAYGVELSGAVGDW